MTDVMARKIAEQVLLDLMRAQPGLLKTPDTAAASGVRLAEFCEAFIAEYAKSVKKNNG